MEPVFININVRSQTDRQNVKIDCSMLVKLGSKVLQISSYKRQVFIAGSRSSSGLEYTIISDYT